MLKDRHCEALALVMTLAAIRSEVRSLRSEVAALDLPGRDAEWFLDTLRAVDRQAAELYALLTKQRRGH